MTSYQRDGAARAGCLAHRPSRGLSPNRHAAKTVRNEQPRCEESPPGIDLSESLASRCSGPLGGYRSCADPRPSRPRRLLAQVGTDVQSSVVSGVSRASGAWPMCAQTVLTLWRLKAQAGGRLMTTAPWRSGVIAAIQRGLSRLSTSSPARSGTCRPCDPGRYRCMAGGCRAAVRTHAWCGRAVSLYSLQCFR